MTATLTVKLPDGTTASRKSDRPYSHAVIVQYTEAYRTGVLGTIERRIATQEETIARETPRAATPEEQASYAAARERVAYLEEEIDEQHLGFGDKPYPWRGARWLSETFEAGKHRHFGYDAITAARAALDATAQGQIDAARAQISGERATLVRERARIVVGHCYVASWHHSFALAQKGAEKVLGYNHGCRVSVTCEIEVKQPKARRAAVG